MIEKEFKYRLCKRAYEKIRAHYPDAKTKTQVNFYFETEGPALRIRQSENKFLLTLKTSGKKAMGGWSERKEIEVKIALSKAKRLLSGRAFAKELPPKIRRFFPTPFRLLPLGSLKTSRTEIPFERSTFEIDHSRWLGRESFELEVEGNNPLRLKRKIQKFLKINRVHAEPENRSKFSRFMAAKKNG